MDVTTVLIVDDDDRFRSAFEHCVHMSPGLELCASATDLQQGLDMLELRPDVILVDLDLPGGSGIELIRAAVRKLPDTDIMVVTVFGDEAHVMASIEAGATGYLLKDASAADLAQQIHSLREGGSPISPVIARRLLMRLAPERQSLAIAESLLSAQERQVLTYSAKGFNFDEVARMMGVSRHTVMTYVKRSYRKLQVHSKTEAIYEARKLGLVRD